jgi:monoamine oxidase
MTNSKPELNVAGLRFRKSLPDESTPLWLDTTPGTRFPVLRSNLSVDVAVIGGGIAGITAAVLLKKSGATVALLEANRVVKGVSGHTTAKVTSQHTLIYQRLIGSFGKEHAHLY